MSQAPASFTPARSPQEEERLAALHDLRMLDTPREAVYDAAVAVAARACNAPIAYISLVDRDRQWFKATFGVPQDLRELPRDTSFCGHTILGDGLLEVPDTTVDPRFRTNPLVVNDPWVRFYAGVVLRHPAGHAVGTLCVIDRAPRVLTVPERDSLRHLGLMVARLLAAGADTPPAPVPQERMFRALDALREAVVMADAEGRVTHLNPNAENLTGWTRDEAVGVPIATVLRLDDGPADAETSQARPALPPGQVRVLTRRDGVKFTVEAAVTALRADDGTPAGTLASFHLMDDIRGTASRMSYLAHHDALTDLPNRVLLHDRTVQAIARARRHRSQIALLFIDLDRFKYVNDSLGHPVGDKLLQAVARRLTASVRSSDTVCRQGGDEFVVLLSEIDGPADAAHTAKKLIAEGAEPYEVDAHELQLSFSIGISIYPDDGTDADALIRHADAAMYHAKQRGRNNYQFFTREMNARAAERLSLEGGLRLALKLEQFVLNYQPRISVRSGGVAACEALLRWRDGHAQGHGLRVPAEFLRVAQESGLIVPIGAWVLREACRQLRGWQDQGLPPFPVAINVSAGQFRARGFVESVGRVLAETGLEPQMLELEVTEAVLTEDPDLSMRVLTALRAMGCRLTVDDFGTGYTSLGWLRNCPVDALKIDRSFVAGMIDEADAAAVVTATIHLAHSMNFRVIAEGVESAEQVERLIGQRCDEMQGYYFCRPLAAPEFTQLLRGDTVDTLRLPRIGPLR